jgi:hypothetical protein
VTNTSTTDVAPICAVLSHVIDSVSSSINHVLRRPSDFSLHDLYELNNIVKFVVSTIPLAAKIARIFATSFRSVLSVEAILITIRFGRRGPRALCFSKRLIVSYVGCKSSELFMDIHVLH